MNANLNTAQIAQTSNVANDSAPSPTARSIDIVLRRPNLIWSRR